MPTPKYHSELAGKGIEYTWAHAKWSFRRQSLRHKKNRDDFKTLVKTCVLKERISKDLVRKMARKARFYIIAYYLFEHGHIAADAQYEKMQFTKIQEVSTEEGAEEDPNATVANLPAGDVGGSTPGVLRIPCSEETETDDEGQSETIVNHSVKFEDIEKMVRRLKTHRCVLDLDLQFVTQIVGEGSV